MMKKEATISVRFLTSSEGGRHSAIEGDRYGCPLMVNDYQGVDCRFVLEGNTIFELGQEYLIDIKFLNLDKALRCLNEGDEISLWEGKKIGIGSVIKIFDGSEN